MAFCQKCGAQLTPGTKFCTGCGSPVSQVTESAPVNNQASAPAKAPKKPFNKKLLLIIAIGVVVVAAAIVAAVLITKNVKEKKAEAERKAEKEARTFSFSENIDVTFDGYDTLGTLDYEFNDDFFDSLAKKAKDEDALDSLEWSMYINVDRSSELSNGDEIKFKVVYSEDYAKAAKLYFTDDEFTVTVEGLKEVKEEDPFDYITWEQSGMDGDITIRTSIDDSVSWASDVYLDVSEKYYLSSGDEFTISIDEYTVNTIIKNYGIKLTPTEKTFTVGAADKNVESFDDITDDTLSSMQNDAIELIEKDYPQDESLYAHDIEYYGAYTYESWGECVVRLVFKGKLDASDSWYYDDGTYNVYFTVEFDDLITKADETQTYSIDYGSSLYDSDESIKSAVSDRSEYDLFGVYGDLATLYNSDSSEE